MKKKNFACTVSSAITKAGGTYDKMATPASNFGTAIDALSNGNGGTGAMANVTNVYGNYILPACTFTAPAGKRFKAWNVGGADPRVRFRHAVLRLGDFLRGGL